MLNKIFAVEYSCKLSSEEFRKRKETIIAGIKRQVIVKQELNDGCQYTFNYSDKLCNELIEFIKTEKQCCAFFQFDISIKKDKIYFTVKGDEATKTFLETEVEL